MSLFPSADDVYRCIGGLMVGARNHAQLGPKVKASQLIIRFEYTNPESAITIDAQNPEEGYNFNVIFGDIDIKPNVLMTMTADVAHQFWLGKVNLTAALTRGQIKAKGPIQEILKLLPAIQPAYAMYPEHLKSIGRDDLLA